MHFAREQARADGFQLLQEQITHRETPPRKLWEFFLTEFHRVKGVDLPASVHMSSRATHEPSLTQTQAWINPNFFCITTTQTKGEKP